MSKNNQIIADILEQMAKMIREKDSPILLEELTHRIETLEKKVDVHDKHIKMIFDSIKKLLSSEKPKPLKDSLNLSFFDWSRPPKTKTSKVGVDVFQVYADGGEKLLRNIIGKIDDLNALKSIIAQHRFDSSRLAAKWKDPNRLKELIIKQVIARATQGKTFRNYR